MRNDERGALPVVLVIVLVVALVFVAVLLVAGAGDPHRLVNSNQCQGALITYWQPTGTFEVNGALGANGIIDAVSITSVQKPPALTMAFPNIAQSFSAVKGDVWVETTVHGPGGVTITNQVSEKTPIDIGFYDQITNKKFHGTWTGPTVCFPQTGTSLWSFSLMFHDSNYGDGNKVLQTASKSVEV